MNIAERNRVAEIALSIALEHHNPQRELTSQLISDIYGDYLNRDDIGKGFDNLLNSLNDLSLDTPDAPAVIFLTCFYFQLCIISYAKLFWYDL